jgi:methylmalonyl-CoA/ethylmalonyl-CoA epimerase
MRKCPPPPLSSFSDLNFHHIGYAVNDISITAEYYVRGGWELSDVYIDLVQKCKIAFLFRDDFPLIELVAPIDGNSPVIKTLDKMGVTPYHICYEVDNIEQSIKFLKELHFVLFSKPVDAIALENRKICYLYHPHIGLVELLSKR